MKSFHRHHKKFSHSQPTQKTRLFAEGELELKGKVGFILSEDPKIPDVLIQGASLKLAMNGDRVKARLNPASDSGRRTGEIIQVLQRARTSVVGIFQEIKNAPTVLLEHDETLIRVKDIRGARPAPGDMVVVQISEWPTPQRSASGTVVEVLGPRSTAGVDLKAVIRKYELPDVFSEKVQAEADAFGTSVPESAWKGRKTFFDQNVFTIDGADAKDFDDAVSIQAVPGGGWKLGVHIADVANYVREGTELDTEAHRRATSVYLSGSVVPMLPFALSDRLCSLVPNEVRLTLSCLMDIDTSGRITSSRVIESAINSCRRFTYEEVEGILKGSNPPDVKPAVIEDVREMATLSRLIRRLRQQRGSLDFDFPEPYVITDPHGRPIDIKKRARLESHRLIEDFMILANETVATMMKDGPFIYRVHEKPDPAKSEKLKKALSAWGIPTPPGMESGEPRAFQKILAFVEGKPIQNMVQMLILRSLNQAVYAVNNVGHFGLASKCYTHFTSPIRRYPDLLVHRIIKERCHPIAHIERQPQWAKKLPGLAAHASKRERVAVEAEREFFDVIKVRLMEKQVGQTFEGAISSVTNFGFFVQLSTVFVEGLVHVSNLRDDYYNYDEARMTLRGKRTNRVFQAGQVVKVLLASANIVKRQLDFELMESGGQDRPRRKKGGRR